MPEIFGATIILHIKALCACLEHDLLSDIRNKRGLASFCDTDNVIIADDSISCEVANTMYALQHNISLFPSKSICIKIVLIGSLVYELAIGIRHASSVMMQYEESVQKLPMREAVRFKENNTKWTASDLKLHVDAHANALLEHRFKKGDKIALWMEPNQHKVCKNEK